MQLLPDIIHKEEFMMRYPTIVRFPTIKLSKKV